MEKWDLVYFSGSKDTLECMNAQLREIQHRVGCWGLKQTNCCLFYQPEQLPKPVGLLVFSYNSYCLGPQPILSFQRLQNLLYLCSCLISMMCKINLSILMFTVLRSVRKIIIPSALSYLKLMLGTASALISIFSLFWLFSLLFFLFF